MTTRSRTRSRTTAFIKRRQGINLTAAFEHADAQGFPLNTWVSITFRGSKLYPGGATASPAETAACRETTLKLLRDFAACHRFPAAFAWVLERASGHGLHMHVLCHLPADHARLRRELEHQLHRVFAWQPAAEAHGHCPVHIADACLHAFQAHRRLNYMLKGIEPGVAQYRRTDGDDPEPQGRIIGKRAGVSRNLDRSARRSAGRGREVSAADLCPRRYRDRIRDKTRDRLRDFMQRRAVGSSTAV